MIYLREGCSVTLTPRITKRSGGATLKFGLTPLFFHNGTESSGNMLRMNFPHRKNKRREEANARNEAYSKLTTEQKIQRLPKDGARNQRIRYNVQETA